MNPTGLHPHAFSLGAPWLDALVGGLCLLLALAASVTTAVLAARAHLRDRGRDR
jgi:hypothetical protein